MKIDINNCTKDYNNKNIIVIGDIILDTYVLGNVNRISQEAPVPIVSMQKKDFKPGGAANVAINLSNLGATVTLVGAYFSNRLSWRSSRTRRPTRRTLTARRRRMAARER